MTKPLSLRAWKTRYAPTWKDRHIETAWLEEHSGYGGQIHEATAEVLVGALKEPTTRAVGHALYFKLFAEYGNALEVAGAWGWALRTRRDHALLLDALLTYPDNAPRDFYAASRRNRSGSLVRLLELPSEAKVVEALGPVTPDWSDAERRQSLPDCVRQAKFLADRYFEQDEVVRSTYNRAKHGATMLHDESLTVREFWVIAPHLAVRGPRDTARYLLPKFTVDTRMILDLQNGVTIAGSMIRYLAALAKGLNDAGLLYPGR